MLYRTYKKRNFITSNWILFSVSSLKSVLLCTLIVEYNIKYGFLYDVWCYDSMSPVMYELVGDIDVENIEI